MPTFKLTWTIDAEGTDALDAARRVATDYFQARIAQGHPNTACVFQLTDHEGQAVTIDLAEHRYHLECAHATECRRLRGDFEELAERYGKLQAGEDSLLAKVVTERDQALAELSALKAQQVGQEPAGEVHLRTGGGISLLHVELAQPLPPGTKLYTALQPAPAQDVAGWIPVTERLPEVETDVLVRGVRRNEVMHRVAGLFNGEWSSQETEDLLLGEVTHWMPLPAAPAAHDKQSRGATDGN